MPTMYIVMVLQGTSYWGPDLFLNPWILGLKTSFFLEAEQGIMTFYWGGCSWLSILDFVVVIVVQNEPNPFAQPPLLYFIILIISTRL